MKSLYTLQSIDNPHTDNPHTDNPQTTLIQTTLTVIIMFHQQYFSSTRSVLTM